MTLKVTGTAVRPNRWTLTATVPFPSTALNERAVKVACNAAEQETCEWLLQVVRSLSVTAHDSTDTHTQTDKHKLTHIRGMNGTDRAAEWCLPHTPRVYACEGTQYVARQ